MKTHVVLLSFSLSFALTATQAGATTATRTLAITKLHPSRSELTALRQPTLALAGTPAARHLFPVRDEKGLLLSCVAPEMGVNSDTDVFKHCTLAPGRTLDEFMHSVIKAVHQEQQDKGSNAGSSPDGKEDGKETSQTTQKPDQKASER